MEPITIWREDDGRLIERPDDGTGGVLPDGAWTKLRALPRAEYDALAAEAADARTLRAERDSLVKERERANQSVIESLAIARKALEENDRAEAVLIDKAGVDGDDLAACCEALLVQRDAATARAEKAEALLREARTVGIPIHRHEIAARIDALLNDAPTDEDRRGEDGAWTR